MSWLKKKFNQLKNFVGGLVNGVAPKPPPIPAPAAASGKGNLKDVVKNAVDKTFNEKNEEEIEAAKSGVPLPSKTFCEELVSGYEAWYKGLHAGIMSPNPAGAEALKLALRTPMFSGWGAGFAAYWQTTVWLPMGVYTGGLASNAAMLGPQMQAEIVTMLTTNPPPDSDAFSERIADILYTYTTRLIVLATLTTPPYSKPETVM